MYNFKDATRIEFFGIPFSLGPFPNNFCIWSHFGKLCVGGLEEDVNVEPERRRPSNEDEFNVDDGDEMADFIDDDDGRENGDQTRRARRQKSSQGVSSHGVQVRAFYQTFLIYNVSWSFCSGFDEIQGTMS